MLRRDEKITALVDAVYSLTNELGRGEILTHESIRGVLGVEPHEGRWDHVVGRVRKRLLRERGVATWPETNVGYKLLTTKETLERLPHLRIRKARSQARRLQREVTSLPEANLTVHQRQRKAFLEDRIRDMKRTLRREQKVLAALLRPATPMPRRMPA